MGLHVKIKTIDFPRMYVNSRVLICFVWFFLLAASPWGHSEGRPSISSFGGVNKDLGKTNMISHGRDVSGGE